MAKAVPVLIVRSGVGLPSSMVRDTLCGKGGMRRLHVQAAVVRRLEKERNEERCAVGKHSDEAEAVRCGDEDDGVYAQLRGEAEQRWEMRESGTTSLVLGRRGGQSLALSQSTHLLPHFPIAAQPSSTPPSVVSAIDSVRNACASPLLHLNSLHSSSPALPPPCSLGTSAARQCASPSCVSPQLAASASLLFLHSSSSMASSPPRLPYSSVLSPGSTFVGYQKSARSKWQVRVVLLGLDVEGGRCCGRMSALNTPPLSAPLVATYFDGQIIDGVHHHFTQRHWKRIRPFTEHILPAMLDQANASAASAASSSAADDEPSSLFLSSSSSVVPPLPRLRTPLEAMESQKGIPAPSLRSPPLSSASLLLPSPSPSPLLRALCASRFVFMRWKERYFLCGEGGSLSISGYYFLAADRVTGDIRGFYCENRMRNRSFQQLVLHRLQDTSHDGGEMSPASAAG